MLFTYRCTHAAAADPEVATGVVWSTSLAGPWNNASTTPHVKFEEVPGSEVKLMKVYIPRAFATDGKLFDASRSSSKTYRLIRVC